MAATTTPPRSETPPTVRNPLPAGAARLSPWTQWLTAFRRLERSPRASGRLLYGVWLVTRIILLLSVIFGHAYSDPQFYHYAGQFAVGQLPYRDIQVEYPPLVFVLLLLPALPLLLFPGIAPRPDAAFTHVIHLPQPDPARYGAYAISFAVEMLIIDLITLWLVRRAARRLAPGDPGGLRAGLLYLSLTFASGALLQKFDLVVGTLCLGAALALIERRPGLAWGLLAAATLVKGYPVLVAPVFVFYELEQARRSTQARGFRAVVIETWRRAWRPLASGFAWFVAVTLGVALLIVVSAGPDSLFHALILQGGRDFEIESLYANLMLALGWLPGLAVHTTFSADALSRVVLSPLTQPMDVIATGLPILALLASYLLLARASVQRSRSARWAADARTIKEQAEAPSATLDSPANS